MKFYYIDDTMFLHNEFHEMILYRFMNLYEKNHVSVLFISSTHQNLPKFQQYLDDIRNSSLNIICSPSCFEVGELRGVLNDTSLQIDGYPTMESYTGSCIEYDTHNKSCRRIYLELFQGYQFDAVDEIVKEIERMLQSKAKPKKVNYH